MSKIIQEQCSQCGKYTKLSWKRLWVTAMDLCSGHPLKVSELEEYSQSKLSDEDCIMISDISGKKSVRVSLKTLKKYFKTK
jgi:hypothetical protein